MPVAYTRRGSTACARPIASTSAVTKATSSTWSRCARELVAAVVPVLLDAFRERHEETLAVGQGREARESLGARAGAAAPVEDEDERGGSRAEGRGHVQVIAAGDPVDLEGVGHEGPLRRGRGGGRQERGQEKGERPRPSRRSGACAPRGRGTIAAAPEGGAPMTTDLLETVKDGVAVLTLNRPDRLNAMSRPMLDALLEALPRLADDPAVGVVVLTGAGRGFCAGGAVKAMAAGREFGGTTLEEKAQALRSRMETSRWLHEMPKPTIAMVRGPAAGAGLWLPLPCAMRTARAT